MKLAVPDLISNSYFPAVAAVELGFFEEEGLDVALELIFPVDKAYRAMRDGSGRFRRRLGAFGARRLSRMGRRKAALRAGAGHVLVSRHARRHRRRARRCRRGSRAPHRRRALGRDGSAPAADRGRHRPRARRRDDRPGAGRRRSDGVNFGADRRQGARRRQDRRVLGERHGDRGRRAPRRRHRRSRRAPRRRAEGLLQLHDGVARGDRPADRQLARDRGGGSPRHRQGPGRAAGRTRSAPPKSAASSSRPQRPS